MFKNFLIYCCRNSIIPTFTKINTIPKRVHALYITKYSILFVANLSSIVCTIWILSHFKLFSFIGCRDLFVCWKLMAFSTRERIWPLESRIMIVNQSTNLFLLVLFTFVAVVDSITRDEKNWSFCFLKCNDCCTKVS